MEILRIKQNPWGQKVLEGVSWDLLWVFVGAGLLFILAHMLYKRFLAPKQKNSEPAGPRSSGETSTSSGNTRCG